MQQDTNDISEESIRPLLRAAGLTADELLGTLPAVGELQTWLAQDPLHTEWRQELANPVRLSCLIKEYQSVEADTEAELEKFDRAYLSPEATGNPKEKVPFLWNDWLRYAAVLLLIAGAATFLYINNKPAKPITQTTEKPVDILPGGNRAILTLSDGSTIVLDSVAIGNVASQGNTRIIKLHNGQLAYNSGVSTDDGANRKDTKPDRLSGQDAGYNTISTPKGGQYNITLSDGTKVWLNAASSIRFPASFSKERTVEITGESYLEITAGKNRPFVIMAAGEQIQVLGTSLNVNAYEGQQAVKTSLLTGSVKIGTSLLKPGEAYINGQVVATSAEQDIAWKNGVFDFDKVPLQRAMRQIANWYDLEIMYQNGIPNIIFGGQMQRNLSLPNVLKFLEKMDVHFEMHGRRLIIYP